MTDISIDQLDAMTGGAFTAASSQERAERIEAWLKSQPSAADLQQVHKELSQKDSGVAKLVKEVLDTLKEQEQDAALKQEWLDKGEALCGADKMNIADGLAWLRDAEKALGEQWNDMTVHAMSERVQERVSGIEHAERDVQALLESGTFFARRIEALSTKTIDQAGEEAEHLAKDIQEWMDDAQQLPTRAQWSSVDAKYPPRLEAEQKQLQLVWTTFQDVLKTAQQAKQDSSVDLPAVPVWAEEIRNIRGAGDAAPSKEVDGATRAASSKTVKDALQRLEKELEQGHGKSSVQAANDLRNALRDHQSLIGSKLEFEAQNALNAAQELEGWQKWRANQIREKLIVKAQALAEKPHSGHKQQEALRALRNEWKQTDQGGLPNHTLWKQFDQACNEAYKTVQEWVRQIKVNEAEHKMQRLALIDEVNAWTRDNVQGEQGENASSDWKAVNKVLRSFAERWRIGGHVSEKVYAEIFPKWKTALAAASAPLEAVQQASIEKRRELIAQAKEVGALERLDIKAIQALQQEWKVEAQKIPLERRREQKLWNQFRKPLDEAFTKRDAAREKQKAQASAHDQAVMAAAQALEEANATGDAQKINAAMQHLQAVVRGEVAAKPETEDTPETEQKPEAVAAEGAEKDAADAAPEAGQTVEAAPSDTEASDTKAENKAETEAKAEGTASDAASDVAQPEAETATEEKPEEKSEEKAEEQTEEEPAKPVKKKLVAMRGDDRPGAKLKDRRVQGDRDGRGGKDSRGGKGRGNDRDGGRDNRRDNRRGERRDGGRDNRRDDRRSDRRDDRRDGKFERRPRAPRLSNAAFHAQKAAMNNAQDALKNLSKQAHGAVLVQLLDAWKQRSTDAMPDAAAFKNLSGSQHKTWQGAIETAAGAASADALLRLEVAADVPTPAAHHDARRAMQLKLLTERDRAEPKETWKEDVTAVLAQAHDDDTSARLQNVLKKLLKTR